MKKITMSIVSILALSGMAFAGGDISKEVVVAETEVVVIPDESAFYVGLGYSYIMGNFKAEGFIDEDIDFDFNAHAVMLQAGYQYNQYIALEGRYTLSVGDVTFSDNTNNNPDEDVDMDISNIAIYLKPMYPVTEAFTVYGLLGYGQVDIDGEEESGFQWGLGANYAINDNLSLFADYTHWYDDEESYNEQGYDMNAEMDINAVTVGLTYKF